MAIKLLDDKLINKIAAGEVIERPASIVKELAENSIDAGSRKINVRIISGGIERIEVEDDGEGIKSDELLLAFLRHATSKISKEEDLFSIATMGFRGEALPSIASVSRIDVYSKNNEDDSIHACFEGGKLLDKEVYPCPSGTKIIIKDLFYNTPARKKFLKSPVTEGNHIYDMMCKYALARPDISFSFSNEKRLFFKTPGRGKLRDAAIAVYGHDLNEDLLDVFYEGETYTLSGLISTPEISRANRKNQIFFINNRPVRSPLLYKTVDNAYKGLLISREHPVVILNINMPAEDVDVNVHPQKTEVRFKDEKVVFRLVSEVLRDVLDGQDFRFNNRYVMENPEPVYKTEPVGKNEIRTRELFNIYEHVPDYSNRRIDSFNVEDHDLVNDHSLSIDDVNTDAPFQIIGQCFNSYILVQREDSLWLVDQHAAHERIIYSQLKEQYNNSASEISQLLAFPLSVELSGNQVELIEQNRELFTQLGYSLEIIGYNSVLIRATPGFAVGKEKEIVLELLDLLQERGSSDFRERAIIMMSCKKAIKSGTCLNGHEMVKIIEELLLVEGYKHCPHGRPTMICLDHVELDRMFKR